MSLQSVLLRFHDLPSLARSRTLTRPDRAMKQTSASRASRHSAPLAELHHQSNDMNRLMSGMPGAPAQTGDAAQVDTAEQVYISSLALLKMLKHGARASLVAPSP